MDDRPDRELVRASQRGDVAAFTALTRKHWGHVYAVAYAGSLRHEDAEDIAQETLPSRVYAPVATARGRGVRVVGVPDSVELCPRSPA